MIGGILKAFNLVAGLANKAIDFFNTRKAEQTGVERGELKRLQKDDEVRKDAKKKRRKKSATKSVAGERLRNSRKGRH